MQDRMAFHDEWRVARAAGGAVASLARFLEAAWRVSAQRHRLLQLSDRDLEDMGVSRADARREGWRPFWDLPVYRP